MKKLFLNNAVIRDINLSDYEIAVYVALRSLFDSQKELQFVTYNSVVFELYKNGQKNQYPSCRFQRLQLFKKDLCQVAHPR